MRLSQWPIEVRWLVRCSPYRRRINLRTERLGGDTHYQAAQRGQAYREMTGPARALCYRLAVSTGLRFSEIASVTPESFVWSPGSATVNVAAGYTKNGDPATLPLPEDVAADLRRWVADINAGTPVFPLPSRGADMLKVDLEAAGVPYREAAGLVFDFHALRCQCATLADGSPRLVQQMMRHSDLKLTGRYTRHRNVEIERVAHQLPSLRAERLPEDASTDTGVQPIKDRFAHRWGRDKKRHDTTDRNARNRALGAEEP